LKGKESLNLPDDFTAGAVGIEDLVEKSKKGSAQNKRGRFLLLTIDAVLLFSNGFWEVDTFVEYRNPLV
jgi:hypothetical protein